MRQRLPLLLSLVLLSSGLQAQAEQEVLAVIDRFFATMTARDTAAMAQLLTPEGVLYAVRADGTRPPRAVTHKEYMTQLVDVEKKEPILERYWEPEVRVDEGIATVWAAYDFHVDGHLSHCGMDLFTLVKDGTQWKISGGMFTMKREGCPESPLGPVK